jgi:hypothetical protein
MHCISPSQHQRSTLLSQYQRLYLTDVRKGEFVQVYVCLFICVVGDPIFTLPHVCHSVPVTYKDMNDKHVVR